MRIIASILTITALFLVGCSSSERKNKSSRKRKFEYSEVLRNKNLILIDLDTMKKEIGKYSSFYSRVKYVPLETTDESQIGKIEHIEIFNDTLLIFDSESAKAIFVFDQGGKFIRKIGKTGRGPGEWVQPVSFSVDKKNRELMILDGSLQKVFRYSISGKFLSQISLSGNEIRSHCIECYNDKIFLDAKLVSQSKSYPGYLLREIDTKGQTINKWFDTRYNKGWNQGENPWYLNGSGTLYSSPTGIKYVDLFMDTIFSINSNGISPFIALKSKDLFSADRIAEMLNSNSSMVSFLRAAQNGNGIFAIRSYVENDDLIRFLFSQGSYYREIIISKKTMIPVCLKRVINDIIFRTEHDMYFPDFYCGEKNIIVGKVNNLVHFQECLRTEETNLTEEEKAGLLSIQPADNPLLIILQTK